MIWCRKLAIALIKAYQVGISPFLPSTCRFYPSCSEYAVQAIGKYGLWHGGVKACRRVLRCHPFSPGGYDPV
jgi:hypothetical protein